MADLTTLICLCWSGKGANSKSATISAASNGRQPGPVNLAAHLPLWLSKHAANQLSKARESSALTKCQGAVSIK